MLQGQKPLAFFSDRVPATFDWGERRFDPYVKQGRLIKKEYVLVHPVDHLRFRYVYFACPEFCDTIEKLHSIHAAFIEKTRPFTEEDDRKIGQFLGYTPHEIDVFLNWSAKFKKEREGQS